MLLQSSSSLCISYCGIQRRNPKTHHLSTTHQFLPYFNSLPLLLLCNTNSANKPNPRILSSSSSSTKPISPKHLNTTRGFLKKPPIISEGRDEDEKLPVCPGCGVIMQDNNPDFPGYYVQRQVRLCVGDDELGKEFDDDGLNGDMGFDVDEEEEEEEEDEMDVKGQDQIDWEFELEDDEEEEWKKNLDGFGPAGIGYGNITEETLKEKQREKISKSEKKKRARESMKFDDEVLVCARCHSLRHYGQVKNQKVENLIPDFDFDRLISTRLMKSNSNSASVIVIVVDCVDFDGSFPKKAANSLFKSLEGQIAKFSKFSKLPKLVLVATKVDLLPSQISPARLDKWVRHRAKANGAPKLSGVYLVSAKKDLGVRNLLSFIKELAGPRGNVWVIGAQNAGKSTLINSLAKKGGAEVTRLTEAAIPGTTLGILRIGGILPANAKMYDTPGLLHPYLMSVRLNREEQKMVEIRKELQPRTYRIKLGQSVHLGALLRLDLTKCSVDTIYVSVWVSPNISLHLGKTESASETLSKHAGIRLQPPIGQERVPELGQWTRKDVTVSGVTWEANSMDIAIAGLGWFSIGLKGEATMSLWTYNGIEIAVREPLVLDRAPFSERPGFLLPKAISDAVGNQSKLNAKTEIPREEKEADKVEASVG